MSTFPLLVTLTLCNYQKTDGMIVVDAGGVTIDISTYAPDPTVPTSFNEIAVPQRD